MTSVRETWAGLVVVVAVGVAGCGGGADEAVPQDGDPRASEPGGDPVERESGSVGAVSGEPAGTDVDPGAESSPFVVEVPNGYELVAAGRGSGGALPAEGMEPLTLLAAAGEDAMVGEEVFVSTVDLSLYPGGWQDAAVINGDPGDPFHLDGQSAIFTSTFDWDQVVMPRGDGLAARARAEALGSPGRDGLAEVVRRAELASASEAPAFAAVPSGFEIEGSLDADAVLAMAPTDDVTTSADALPGPASAHVAVFRDGPQQVTVMALPGQAGDAELGGALAEARGLPVSISLSAVDGVAEVTLEHLDEAGTTVRSEALVDTGWGDLVVVVGTGSVVPPVDQLADVARSARQADADEWNELVLDAA